MEVIFRVYERSLSPNDIDNNKSHVEPSLYGSCTFETLNLLLQKFSQLVETQSQTIKNQLVLRNQKIILSAQMENIRNAAELVVNNSKI